MLTGCGTALVTPFRGGEVDGDALRRLVRRQVAAGVDFLVPLGSTAETPCLTDEEKVFILKTVREEAPGLPLIAGVGTNSLIHTVRNLRLLEGCGADGWLVVVPYYNKPTQEGMYRYFRAVADETDKPVVLYNVPGRTGSHMAAETTLRIARDAANVVAVKEASGRPEQMEALLKGRQEDFSVLSGEDAEVLEVVLAGAQGIISVASNVAPAEEMALLRAAFRARKGDAAGLEEARALYAALAPLYAGCFIESNPIPVKAALSLLGLCSDEMRLPLTPAVAATRERLKEVLRGLKML